MSLTAKTVDHVNRDAQQLPLTEARLAELPVELGQFADVMERVRARVGFDDDPADFRRALAPSPAAR